MSSKRILIHSESKLKITKKKFSQEFFLLQFGILSSENGTFKSEVVILNTMVNKLEYYTQNIRLLNIIHLNFIYIFDDSHTTDY